MADTFITRNGDGLHIEGKVQPLAVNGDAGGWKLHIGTPREFNTEALPAGSALNASDAARAINDPNTRAIFKFVEQHAGEIVQAKVGGGGVAADGKGMTVYLGSRKNMESFVAKLETYIKDNNIAISDPTGDVIGDDLMVGKSGKLMARWDTALRKGMLPSGLDGVSIPEKYQFSADADRLNLQLGKITQEEWLARKQQYVLDGFERTERKYGEYFTGVPAGQEPDWKPKVTGVDPEWKQKLRLKSSGLGADAVETKVPVIDPPVVAADTTQRTAQNVMSDAMGASLGGDNKQAFSSLHHRALTEAGTPPLDGKGNPVPVERYADHLKSQGVDFNNPNDLKLKTMAAEVESYRKAKMPSIPDMGHMELDAPKPPPVQKADPIIKAPPPPPVAKQPDPVIKAPPPPPMAKPTAAAQKTPATVDVPSPGSRVGQAMDLANRGAGTAVGAWGLINNVMQGDEIGSAISAADLVVSLLKNAPRALGPGITVFDGAYQVAKEARGANEAEQPVPDLTEKMADRAVVTTVVGGVGMATSVALGAGAAPVVATIAVTAAVGKVAEETIATNADFREAQRAFEQSANNKHINSIAYRGAYVDKVLEQGGKLQEGVPGKKLDLGDTHTRELLRDAIADRQKELQAVVDAGSKMDIRSGSMPGWLRNLVVAASPQAVVINQLIPGSEAYANKVNEAMLEQQLLNAASKELVAVDKSARIRDEIRERLMAEAAVSPDAATLGADKSADTKKPDVMDYVEMLQQSGRTFDNPSATPPSVAASANAPGMTGMGIAKGPGKEAEGRS